MQVVASMVPGSAAGRSLLSARLTARLHVAVARSPDVPQLEAIYTRMIQQVCVRGTCSAAPVQPCR